MSQALKSLAPLVLVALAALAVGRALPRPRGGGDMLDAVAAVQRRSPHFLISDPKPYHNWAKGGALYLCRAPRTGDEMEALCKDRSRAGPGWAGVVCFRGTADPGFRYLPGASDGGANCLHYGAFAVYGDPEMLEEVREALAAEGFGRPRAPAW